MTDLKHLLVVSTVFGTTLLTTLVGAPRSAEAYRPFDGTDADVAGLGQFELELGPGTMIGNRSRPAFSMPAATFNFGVAPGWEVTISTQNLAVVGQRDAKSADAFDSEMRIKTVLLPGCLQGGKGPSIAAEFGAFYPSADRREAPAGAVLLIASQILEPITFHINLEVARDAANKSQTILGVIAEGPEALVVRPVTEIEAQAELGGAITYSALAGAIWRAIDSASLDAALRATVTDRDVWGGELRVGVTWHTPLFHPRSPPPSDGERGAAP